MTIDYKYPLGVYQPEIAALAIDYMKRPIEIWRATGFELHGGERIEKPTVKDEILGVVISFKNSEILKLPEHLRVETIKRLYTKERDLVAAIEEDENSISDRVVYLGNVYEIYRDTNQDMGEYYQYILKLEKRLSS